jgi:hypothetical protein
MKDAATAAPAGSACILNVDPPGYDEYIQCGCLQCSQDVRDKALELLTQVHKWFMKSAPERYNGCGLWIDVDEFLAEALEDKP